MNITIPAEIIIDDTSHLYLFFSHIPRIGEEVTFFEESGHEEIQGHYKVVNICWLVMPEDWGHPADEEKNASTGVVITLRRITGREPMGM